MSFISDKQTLEDLNLLGKYKPNSIFSLFNQVRTGGGERLLQEMFHQPLTEMAQINERKRFFKYFQDLDLEFPFSNALFTQVESFLSMGTGSNYLMAFSELWSKKMMGAFLRDEQYDQLYGGLLATIEMLNSFNDFLEKLENSKSGNLYAANRQRANEEEMQPYEKELQALKAIFSDKRMQWIRQERGVQQLSLRKVVKYDYLLKQTLSTQMEFLMESVYRLDVYLAVSSVSRNRDFSYADALPAADNLFETTALWHPGLLKGVANSLRLEKDLNMVFLTGANMAGKSTFMKSFGIAIYLAHMGFPVAAKNMKFSVRDGLYSSINVPDDLNMGYSHFYAEVLRVKKVAEEVSEAKNLIVLFDELFKGTNVKDAYDATLSVTKAFSAYRNCFFMISTHIIEVGETLKESCNNLQFTYLPTVMDGNVPRYTYKLEEGITTDRQGMLIIENEGILEVLRNN